MCNLVLYYAGVLYYIMLGFLSSRWLWSFRLILLPSQSKLYIWPKSKSTFWSNVALNLRWREYYSAQFTWLFSYYNCYWDEYLFSCPWSSAPTHILLFYLKQWWSHCVYYSYYTLNLLLDAYWLAMIDNLLWAILSLEVDDNRFFPLGSTFIFA